jgi:hypothetical protein
MLIQRLVFNGALLERGFWLYAWRVTAGDRVIFYVGRTGDSSSRYAASPFSRLGQHLDVRPKASANMVLRQVRKAKIDPLSCKYELVAFGPLFPERDNLEEHRLYRDRVAPLESALAQILKSRGFEVVGKHGKAGKPDPDLLKQIENAFNAEFVAVTGGPT